MPEMSPILAERIKMNEKENIKLEGIAEVEGSNPSSSTNTVFVRCGVSLDFSEVRGLR
jgi:hypothetical protein